MKTTPEAPWEEEEDLRRFFTLTLEDLRFVASVRSDTMRLYRALVLVWARVERVLLSDPCSVPAPVVAFVCKQLGLKPDLLARLPLNSSSARTTTYEAVRTYLQLRPWTAEDVEALRTHLTAVVAQTGNSAVLLNAADDWIAHQEVLRPAGATTIERLVYEIQYATEEALYEQIARQLTADHCAQLDALCHTESAPSLLVQLAAPPRRASAEAIKEECTHLETIRAALPTPLDWGTITRNRQRQWAAIIKRLRTQEVRHYPAAKRSTLLCAFLVVRAEEITNVIVEMFDELVRRIFARSDADLEQARLAQSQAYQESARLFGKVAQVLLDTEIPPEQVREEIFKRVPRGRISALVDQSLALEQGETATYFAILEKRWPHLREFAPRVLETLAFGSPRVNNATLEAVRVLAEMNRKGQRTLAEEVPLEFIPRKWEKVVQTSAGVDKHAWEWCLVHEMRAALRAGDLTVDGSRRYAAWDSDLYTAKAWQKRRTSWYQEMGLPEDGATYARAALADLHQHSIGVGRRLSRNTAVRIEDDKIVLAALEKVELPKEAEEARRDMLALFPHPGLPDLLMEVDRWAHFTEVFFHLTSRRPPTPEQVAQLRPALFAVLVAEATNLSFATMAHASGISEDQLERVNDWYVREETLRQAITTLITYHRTLPLTFKFGAGTTSSSDGIRFGIAASALNARHNPRYFGVKQGVTLYNHTSDQSQNRWIDVVNCLMRDANYVLDGLLYQDALPIEEHYTDTAGYTDLVFGLFQMLGFRFAPRLRDLPDQVLYRAEKGDHYGALNPVLQKSIREALIATHWDDINRLAASLKDGLVVPSLVIAKLQAMQRHNPLQQAIQEIGRIGKTKHILSYIDDEHLRRRVLVGLNKGELLHAMARAIFFGRQGRFPDRGYEAQLSRATALSLVLNAMVVWNTRYLAATAEALRERERPLLIEDATWKHLSPILWEHVHLVGTYQFSEPQIEGELRPLRMVPTVGKIKASFLRPAPSNTGKHSEEESGQSEAPALPTQEPAPPLVQLALLAGEESEEVPAHLVQREPGGAS